jgi:hypothetical protein
MEGEMADEERSCGGCFWGFILFVFGFPVVVISFFFAGGPDFLESKLRERELAASFEKSVQSKNWDRAISLQGRLRSINEQSPLLKKFGPQIDTAQMGREVARTREERARETAETVSSHNELREALGKAESLECSRGRGSSFLSEFQEIRSKFDKVSSSDPFYDRAKRLLAKMKRCRRVARQIVREKVCEKEASDRENRVERVEERFWDDGMNVKASLHGECKTRLVLRYSLWNRAMIHNLTDGTGLLEAFKKSGFTYVAFTTGRKRFTYTWDENSLNKRAEDAMESWKVAKPLALGGPK